MPVNTSPPRSGSALAIARGRLLGARWRPSPSSDARPAPRDISLLVIHGISLPPGQFGGPYIEQLFMQQLQTGAHPYFARIAQLQVSAHCVIDRRGRLTQYVPFDHRAWHAGVSRFGARERCNDFSIGVELEGSDQRPYTAAQYRRLAALARALLRVYPRLTPARIVGHSDIAPGRKTDPGPYFDWARFRRQLPP